MFHMLSCFNLKSGVNLDEFRTSNDLFVSHMLKHELIQSASSIGRRNKHPIMDTDKLLNQEYYYVITFKDEDQCNRAVECIHSHVEPEDTIHRDVTSKTENQSFIFWEDVQNYSKKRTL